uniref:Ribosomal protein L14 n=1 Tax=Aconitum vilmorinianum TaxID=226101 RepID=A0A410D089_9MAGN|nr:ribosomal protein L14 [Aconitum vilmorinianum]
MLILATLLLL